MTITEGNTVWNGVTKTPNQYPTQTYNRVDFEESEFDILIEQKGRRVMIEKSCVCPCKSSVSNHLSTCKNCGGTGIFFISREETKIVIQGMNVSLEYKPWSEEVAGMVNITCKNKEKLNYLDRITVLDAESVYDEVLHFKESEETVPRMFSFTVYNVKRVMYCAMFQGISTPHKILVEGTDYTITDNKVFLDAQYTEEDISVTIKYCHEPAYYVMELRRETMDSYKYVEGKDKLIHLPTSAIGKRANYVADSQNLKGDRIISNLLPINTNTCAD